MWHLNDNYTGTIQPGDYNLTVDLRRPENGVQLSYKAEPLDGLWLGALTPGRIAAEQGELLPEAITDAYTRGTDLVATYAQGLNRTVRPQIYWRVAEVGPASQTLAIELVLSVQSNRLQSQPEFPVATTVPAFDDEETVYTHKINWTGETADPRLQGVAPVMHYWKMPVAGVWAAAMPHPGDNATVESGCNAFSGAFEMTFNLFPLSVEKGVIRRSRILMLLAAGGLTEDEARQNFAAEFERWTSSALPLTV